MLVDQRYIELIHLRRILIKYRRSQLMLRVHCTLEGDFKLKLDLNALDILGGMKTVMGFGMETCQ